MNKKALAAHVVAGVGALVLLLLVAVQMAQLGKLQQAVDSLADRLAEHDSRISNELSDAQARMDQSVSLFDTLENALHYRSEGLMLTLRVVPKTMRHGDALYLALEGQEPMALSFSPDTGTYSIECKTPPVVAISPVLMQISADGVTQRETLPPHLPRPRTQHTV